MSRRWCIPLVHDWWDWRPRMVYHQTLRVVRHDGPPELTAIETWIWERICIRCKRHQTRNWHNPPKKRDKIWIPAQRRRQQLLDE